MRRYDLGGSLGAAMGTENIKCLSDEKARIKLMESIKFIANAVFDKFLAKKYGNFEDFWQVTKQLQVNEASFGHETIVSVYNYLEYEELYSDLGKTKEKDLGVKLVTMQALKAAYEQVNNNSYVFGAMLIPEDENLGFLVYLRVATGKYIGIACKFIESCKTSLQMFGECCLAFDDLEEEWNYACQVFMVANQIEML